MFNIVHLLEKKHFKNCKTEANVFDMQLFLNIYHIKTIIRFLLYVYFSINKQKIRSCCVVKVQYHIFKLRLRFLVSYIYQKIPVHVSWILSIEQVDLFM